MKIELLGTGGYYANSRRHTACLLFPEWGLIFDAGSALYRFPSRCSAPHVHLFLTHAHLDHISGLPFLLMPILSHQVESLTVHGTQATLDAVSEHLFAEPIFPVPIPFACHVMAPQGEWELKPGVSVRWQALPSHPGGSMAYRVDEQQATHRRSMAYITDTSIDGTYSDFVQNVDLLVHECYFADDRKQLATRTGHSHASEVAELAKRSSVGQLVIVHVDPTQDVDDPIGLPGMQSIFPRTKIGIDGMHLQVCGSNAK